MKIIAHRGDSANAPENTLKAFRQAWSAGVDGIELDVQLTADGEVVVFHDADGSRLAGDARTIRQCNWSALRNWRIWGETIPLLKDVLAETPPSTLTMIEIKDGPDIVPMLHELVRFRPVADIAVLAFDPTVASAAKQLGTPVWLNVEAPQAARLDEIMRMVRELDLSGISMGWSDAIDRSLVARVHEASLPLAVWTVNEPADALRVRDWGVDLLMTDDPGKILRALAHE